MYNFKQILFTAALCVLSSAASAVTINGSIAFGTAPGASWTPTPEPTATTANATGVNFNEATSGVYSGFSGLVSTADGDYLSTIGEGVIFNDFTFNPLTSGTNLWSFTSGGNSYSFNMTSVTIVNQDASSIGLKGFGLANATGFDETFGTWVLTLNNSGGSFSFSSSAAVVPEPALALLLGTGLIGFGVARKMRKTA